MQLHRVTIDTAWQPDGRGVRHRHYFPACLCGWSGGPVATRLEAAGLGDDHRSAAAAANARARAGAMTPDPAA
jgi:hypothetical protein